MYLPFSGYLVIAILLDYETFPNRALRNGTRTSTAMDTPHRQPKLRMLRWRMRGLRELRGQRRMARNRWRNLVGEEGEEFLRERAFFKGHPNMFLPSCLDSLSIQRDSTARSFRCKEDIALRFLSNRSLDQKLIHFLVHPRDPF